MEAHSENGRPGLSAKHASFIQAQTEILPPPLVPEVKLHLAHESVPLWQRTEEELGEMGLAPPFWAFAWAGGQALARYILDNAEIVRGKAVIDLASGSGLVGIAAMKAGAASVLAADIDPFSAAAIALNAKLNNVELAVTTDDLLSVPLPEANVLLIGDLFYEQGLAARVLAFAQAAKAKGMTVLIGDPGRSYLPKDKLEKCAEYSVPVSRDLEDAEIKRSAVWQLRQSY
jgi:predicted nicotinamide N-methyase